FISVNYQVNYREVFSARKAGRFEQLFCPFDILRELVFGIGIVGEKVECRFCRTLHFAFGKPIALKADGKSFADAAVVEWRASKVEFVKVQSIVRSLAKVSIR